MKKQIFVFFILLFSFCSKKERSPYPHLIQSVPDLYIKLNSKEMLGVHPNVFGFNFKTDTDGKSYAFEPYEKIKDGKENKRTVIFEDWVVNENYVARATIPNDTIRSRIDLKVIVDTTYTIIRKNFEYKNIYGPYDNDIEAAKKWVAYYHEVDELQKKYVECYPVLVYNNSKHNALFGPLMIQEAKDVDGKWKPIEFIKRGTPSCMVGPYPILFSKSYMGAAIIKYQGNFKTKLRIKYVSNYETYYSNEFSGYINKSQFSLSPYITYYKRNLSKYPMAIPFDDGKCLDFLDYDSCNFMINGR